LSFKLGPGSHYLPNQHSHNVKQQTNSGLLRTLYARKREGCGGERGEGGKEEREGEREGGRDGVRKSLPKCKDCEKNHMVVKKISQL